MELLRVGIGVEGKVLTVADTSDKGGDGGVASVRMLSAFPCGGVDVVGEGIVAAEVDVSERGERGRRDSDII